MMKRLIASIGMVLFGLMTVQAQESTYATWFTEGTLRIDCLRQGNAQADTVWIARMIDRQADWHGSRKQLVDPFDNGDYRVLLRDPTTGRVLYSRGYSNLFREYKDTPEGRTRVATFEETLLLPMPRRAVDIVLQKRDSTMRLCDQHVHRFRPQAEHLMARPVAPTSEAYEVHGPSSEKIDVAYVMQGFDDVDDSTYARTCRRMAEVLFRHEPFSSRRGDFNLYFVRGDAGVDYNTFGADRYAMTFRLWQLHDLLGGTPCDHVIIVFNNTTYGGGAIYNFYSVSSLHSMAEYVLPHELGHGIGGLADEYVDEDLSYADLHRTAYEPLEPNITNLVDFDSKWRKLLKKGTPIPTPNRDVPRTENGPLGVYEGAGYSSKGVYRPVMHCMMRDYAPFCPVCSEHLESVFDIYTR